MREIDDNAISAAKDKTVFQNFIESQKPYIKKCVFLTLRKYITESNDEFSIALIAFSDAVKTYDKSKGAFLSYAENIIKWRLIDYLRKEQKRRPEILVDPVVFETEPNEDDEDVGIKIEVAEKVSFTKNDSIKYEIEAANEEFKKFGFSFYDLAECSPKSMKTKMACRMAILYILDNKEILNDIYQNRQLPIKIIQNNTHLPRKLLEHHRKYIIAATEILSGEYPYLAEYVSFIGRSRK